MDVGVHRGLGTSPSADRFGMPPGVVAEGGQDLPDALRGRGDGEGDGDRTVVCMHGCAVLFSFEVRFTVPGRSVPEDAPPRRECRVRTDPAGFPAPRAAGAGPRSPVPRRDWRPWSVRVTIVRRPSAGSGDRSTRPSDSRWRSVLAMAGPVTPSLPERVPGSRVRCGPAGPGCPVRGRPGPRRCRRTGAGCLGPPGRSPDAGLWLPRGRRRLLSRARTRLSPASRPARPSAPG